MSPVRVSGEAARVTGASLVRIRDAGAAIVTTGAAVASKSAPLKFGPTVTLLLNSSPNE